jgi:hypothetical protein
MRPLWIAVLGVIIPLANAQEIVSVTARPDATQSYLLVAPNNAP